MVGITSGPFFVSGLVDCGALSHAVIVALPHDIGVWGKGKDAFYSLARNVVSILLDWESTYTPYFDVSSTIDPRPNTEHILAAPDAENRTADFLSGFGKLIADDRQEEVLPVSVRDALL